MATHVDAFFAASIGGRLADRYHIFLPPRPKNIKISARFRTTLRLDRDNLRNGTSYGRSESGIANYRSLPYTCVPNLVNFDPQSKKNRTPKVNFLDAHIGGGLRAMLHKNLTNGRGWPTNANAYGYSSTIFNHEFKIANVLLKYLIMYFQLILSKQLSQKRQTFLTI